MQLSFVSLTLLLFGSPKLLFIYFPSFSSLNIGACLGGVLFYGAWIDSLVIYLTATFGLIFGALFYRLFVLCLKYRGKHYSKYLILIPFFHTLLDVVIITGLSIH